LKRAHLRPQAEADVTGFPMQWLCFEADRHLDVVRLLGDRQDIVVILLAEE
jgi:toxin ParE1/3/4